MSIVQERPHASVYLLHHHFDCPTFGLRLFKNENKKIEKTLDISEGKCLLFIHVSVFVFACECIHI